MTMQVRLPGLATAAVCAAAACACASFLSAYFGAAWSGMAAFLCCLLLFLSAVMLRPTRGETVACALSGGVFGVMHTLGYSYDTIDSYGLILKNAGTLRTGLLCMAALAAVAFCVCLMLVRLLDALRQICARAEARGTGPKGSGFSGSALRSSSWAPCRTCCCTGLA